MEGMRPTCANGRGGRVRDVFCGETAPEIRGLADLSQRAAAGAAAEWRRPRPRSPAAALIRGWRVSANGWRCPARHSTALSGELVSSINPRAITLTPSLPGVQPRRSAGRAGSAGPRHRPHQAVSAGIRQACNDAARAASLPICTRRASSLAGQVALQDDEDLKNTAADCRQCHQRGTAGHAADARAGRPMDTLLRAGMTNEPAAFPEPAGRDLFQDYVAAKGDEAYGGVPTTCWRATIGFTLQTPPAEQPLVFDGSASCTSVGPVRTRAMRRGAAQPDLGCQLRRVQARRGLALPTYAARSAIPTSKRS